MSHVYNAVSYVSVQQNFFPADFNQYTKNTYCEMIGVLP